MPTKSALYLAVLSFSSPLSLQAAQTKWTSVTFNHPAIQIPDIAYVNNNSFRLAIGTITSKATETYEEGDPAPIVGFLKNVTYTLSWTDWRPQNPTTSWPWSPSMTCNFRDNFGNNITTRKSTKCLANTGEDFNSNVTIDIDTIVDFPITARGLYTAILTITSTAGARPHGTSFAELTIPLEIFIDTQPACTITKDSDLHFGELRLYTLGIPGHARFDPNSTRYRRAGVHNNSGSFLRRPSLGTARVEAQYVTEVIIQHSPWPPHLLAESGLDPPLRSKLPFSEGWWSVDTAAENNPPSGEDWQVQAGTSYTFTPPSAEILNFDPVFTLPLRFGGRIDIPATQYPDHSRDSWRDFSASVPVSVTVTCQ